MICSTEGCERTVHARGLCRSCYKRNRYRGNVLREGLERKFFRGANKPRLEPRVLHTGPIRLGDMFGRAGWVFDVVDSGGEIIMYKGDALKETPWGELITESELRLYARTSENKSGRVIRAAIAS